MAKGFSMAKSVWLYVATALLVVFLNAGPLHAQAQTASISGTATDASGAVLAGAKIVATNVGTNISQATTTDSQGRYRITDLPVGTYTVEASQSGFQTVVHSGITLSVGGYVVVDLSLPVGQVTQTVNVEAEVSRVQTESSEVSTLVSPQQMRDLPLNGRNFEQLLTLAPGVVTIAPAVNAVTGRLYGMQNNYSISGSRPTGQMFLLDNTDIRDFWEHGTGSGYGASSLGVEAIGEFQVLTNTYTAQFAGNGAVVNSVSRSGTNDFHGGAYEFIRNSALDARDINDPLSGPPPFRRNQFGGALGGPIKKDKLFFFANYEGLRSAQELTITGLSLPEPYVAQGQLPCSAAYIPLAQVAYPGCPAWTTTNGVTTNPAINSPVGSAGNPIVNYTSFFNPAGQTAAQQIASLYSLCKTCRQVAALDALGNLQPAGTDLGGYYAVSTTPNLVINEDYILGRVDYNLSSKDSIFARYVIDDARVGDGPRDLLGLFPEQDFTRNQFVTITERRIVSATMVNSLRFSWTRNNENSRVQNTLTPAELSAAGLTSDPLNFVRTLYSDPTRQDGQVGLGDGILPMGPDPNRPDTLIQSKFTGGDDLSWTQGSHSLKIGGVVTRVQTNNIQLAYANGQTYLAQLTAGSVGGVFDAATTNLSSLGGYLSGLPLVGFAVPNGFNNSTRYFREIDVAPYIQDDWKVTPQLTLNIGLRYDFATNPVGWAGGGGPLTSLVAGYLPPIGPQTPPTFVPGQPGTLFTPVKHTFQSNPNTANWGPRFGFAYDPFKDHKTSIRGGFGIFHDPVTARIYESGFIATPPALSQLVIFPGFPDPSNPFIPVPALAPGEFAGVSYVMPNGSPYQMQFNFNVQREIAPGTVFSIGYVGSLGRHLWMQRDINIPKCDTYPDCTALPSVKNPNTGVHWTPPAGATSAPANNPNYGSVVTEATTSSSSYNSLQVSLNHQFAKSFAGQVNYTWSHCIDNGSFATSLEEWGSLLVDAYNQRYDYGNCIFDIRHNLSINGLYSLPFKGNRLVEGWQISTITGIHTGAPLNVAFPANSPAIDPTPLGTQWGTRPNYSFAAGCTPNHIIDKVLSPGIVQWFDPNCYTPQAKGYLGNVGRNSIPGPGAIGVDFSIIKNTKIHESANLQFRAEFFNVINHFNPGAPDVTMGLVGPVPFGATNSSQAPVITPRQIQFAVKLDF